MREIKFRAWDKILKKMGYIYNPSLHCEWNIFDLSNFIEQYDGKIILMQYTGLKDKNGKEIFEGDIVKFRMDFQGNEYNYFEDSFCTDYIGGVVITASKGVCLKYPIVIHIDEIGRKPSKLGYYRQISGCRSEIIGNIYENPDSLKGV